MKLMLVLALLGGQTLFEWVDAKGQSHFTNDESSIPAGVKRRVRQGQGLTVISAARSADAGVASKAPDAGQGAGDSCALAKEAIATLEQEFERSRDQAKELQEREGRECQEVLMLQGQPGFARCMASRTEAAPQNEVLKNELEAARERLRQSQQNGCR